MNNYSIEVIQREKTATVSGTWEVKDGEVHIRTDLPSGILHNVIASMPLSLPSGTKIFMNGYQTWTSCPEYDQHSRIRGLKHVPKALLKKYGFDRYGDYHFVPYPNRKGIVHGVSYCYFRNGAAYRLIASLDERNGYTLFQYDASKQTLTIRRDCDGVRCGGNFAAFDLFFAEGSEAEVFDRWFAAMNIQCRTKTPLAGYSSWYNRYENITQNSILQDLNACQELLESGDLFQIDDGWEPAVGDWLEPDKAKFPDGMKAMADKIHAAGFKAGLWLAPFACCRDSQLYRKHPDWCLKHHGENWFAGGNWGGFYGLDIDNPHVVDYLKAVFHRVLDEWGFDLVKLDFLYAAAPYGTKLESRAGRMYRGLELLRRLCGEKLILGCGVPVMPAFGLMDYCRVSCDVSLDWDDQWFMRLFHRERVSTKQAIGNTLFRRQLNGRAYGSDPDVFFLREDNIRLSPAQKQMLAQVNALLGSVFLTSDDPSAYNVSMRQEYAKLRHLRTATDIWVDPQNPFLIHYTLDGTSHILKLQ